MDESNVQTFFISLEQNSEQRDTFTLNNQLQEELASIELPLIYAQPGSRQNTTALSPPKDSSSERIMDFFFTLAACNTVIVAKHPHRDQVSHLMFSFRVNPFTNIMCVPLNPSNKKQACR